MMNVILAEQNQLTDEPRRLTRGTLLKLFALIAIVAFALRILYISHLYEDDGLWFAAAEEIVRGKALYGEIYFDKPPGLPLVYALLFSLFGAHLIVIRLFTIFYTMAVSALLYLFGRRLYDQRTGVLAAAMFAVFSTSHSLGHVQSLNTDCLMSLPYTAAAFLLIRSRIDAGVSTTHHALLALAGGSLAGIAFQINPKGAFDLGFFAVWLIALRFWELGERRREGQVTPPKSGGWSASLFAIAAGGFVLAALPFLAYIAATGSTSAYLQYVWHWGARYADYYSAGTIAVSAVRFTIGYFALNGILLITLVFAAFTTIKQMVRLLAGREPGYPNQQQVEDARRFKSNATVLIWFAVSYAAVTLGGRFFSHYFLQLLPSLCLIGASGLIGILSAVKRRNPVLRRVVIASLVIGFLFTILRFHGRSVLLALDLARNPKNSLNIGWYHVLRNSEERKVSAVVRDLPDGADAADRISLEGIRAGGPRTRAAGGPTDFVYVWGYRPEIYFWSGLLPASRYLSTQPLTGVPADVQYANGEHRSILDDSATAAAREQLLRDLNETQPKYIVDELGMFNLDLSINSYPELAEFMRLNYKATGAVERFMVYCRRDLLPKKLRRIREKEQ
jgi:4-amino-4-deoxy-L-arabinose transferase-like glycosyltransferase